jgi:hypothetical protein
MVPTTERNNTGKGTDSNQLPAKEFEPPMARDGATKWEQKACTIDTTGRTTETGNAKSTNEDDGRNPSEEQPNEKNAFPDDDERSNPYINNKDERRNPSEEQPNKMKVYQTRTTSVQIGVAELKVEGESLPCAKVVDESLPFEMGVLYDKVEGEDLPCATVVDESLPFEVGVIYDKVADVSLPFAKAVDGRLLNSLNDRFLSTCHAWERNDQECAGIDESLPFAKVVDGSFPFEVGVTKDEGRNPSINDNVEDVSLPCVKVVDEILPFEVGIKKDEDRNPSTNNNNIDPSVDTDVIGEMDPDDADSASADGKPNWKRPRTSSRSNNGVPPYRFTNTRFSTLNTAIAIRTAFVGVMKGKVTDENLPFEIGVKCDNHKEDGVMADDTGTIQSGVAHAQGVT